MFITAERIVRLAPHVYSTTAAALAPIIDEEMPKFGVSTLLRRAPFMAQACWESEQFSRFEENLNYTHPEAITGAFGQRLAARAASLLRNPQGLANAAYAGRNGNGDEASGDGWRYRGRGIFQLTGKTNYAGAAHALGVDLIGNPEWASTPEWAVKTALWFWNKNGCNQLADMDDAEGVTRRINGGTNGLGQREQLTQAAKAIFV
jgi:putative chitinase